MTVSKADMARLLECPRSRITQLCGQGLPTLRDGRLDRDAALAWIVHYGSGAGGGWETGLRGKPSIRTRAQALLNGGTVAPTAKPEPAPESIGPCEALDMIRRAAQKRLPDLARRLGLPEHIAVAAPDIFDCLLALADANAPGIDYDWPFEPDLSSVSTKVRKAAEKYVDGTVQPCCDRIFSAAVLAEPERYPQNVPWARQLQGGEKPC